MTIGDPSTRIARTQATSLSQLDESYRYRLLVEGMLDYALYLLDADGYVSSWNTGAQRFKGYRAEEIIGQHFSCFYTPEDRAAGVPQQALETAARQGHFESEGWRMRKDGTRFWTSAVIDPIRNDAGVLIGFAKITRDITEKKQALDELHAAQEALHQAQKMEALGRLTGGVAHDFNNLLTVIRGSAELLRNPAATDAKRQRYLDAIVDTANRAAHLTRQLLAYARRQPLRPETFDVRQCIENMQQLFHATLGSAIQIEYQLASEACFVRADPNQLETALLNIVINARDAMSHGGSLKIGVRRVDGVPAIRHERPAPGAHIAIAIADSGSGIPPDVLDRVFEPFFTTKPPGRGTGLGLSQVIGFVSQSGGQVDVASTPGHGTTFTLYLPETAASGYEDLLSPGAALAGQAARPRYDILVVEDNAEIGEIVTSLLNELGQSPVHAPDGSTALKILQEREGAFDLVLADIVMPDMSGIDLAHTIRARWPAMRITLATGYSHILADFAPIGFELLNKPYSVEALRKVLDGLALERDAPRR